MEEQQQKQINEAAEHFAEVLRESYQATIDRTVSAQALNAERTQDFFNSVLNNLREQAERNQKLAIQYQERADETGRVLTQETVDAYMEFINSMFSFWQSTAAKSPWPRYPLFDSSDPTFAERVDEELAGFGKQ